jgi:hypothetical protein
MKVPLIKGNISVCCTHLIVNILHVGTTFCAHEFHNNIGARVFCVCDVLIHMGTRYISENKCYTFSEVTSCGTTVFIPKFDCVFSDKQVHVITKKDY